MLAPTPHQFHASTDNIGQTNAGADFINELGWKRHLAL